MLAYVLIDLQEPGEKDIIDTIRNLKEVREAHVLFGEWDILAKVEVKNPNALGTFVMDKIRTLPEVKVTSTMIVARS